MGLIPGSGTSPGEAPVFLPGKFYGQRSLVGYSPWDHRVRHNWATNTHTHTHTHTHKHTHRCFSWCLIFAKKEMPISSWNSYVFFWLGEFPFFPFTTWLFWLEIQNYLYLKGVYLLGNHFEFKIFLHKY